MEQLVDKGKHMSYLGDAFVSRMGVPDVATPSGVQFKHPNAQRLWQQTHAEIGSGWFLDRFLYLFGEGLADLEPCLSAWAFLVKPGRERMILGRNAYGALLVAEEPTQRGFVCPVYVLDPLYIRYWTDPNLDFSGLIGYWLPERQLHGFHDSSLYDAWVKVTGDHLELDEILAIKEPLSLGGKMVAENFQIENVIAYYQSTGAIYAKVFKGLPEDPQERRSSNQTP